MNHHLTPLPGTGAGALEPEIVIRQFTPDDAAAFRAIRLRALQTNPEAFGSTARDFAGRTLDEVRARLAADQDSAEALVLGAFHGDEPVGMMGFFRQTGTKRRHKGLIWGVFVDVNWRRYGIARRLYGRILAFAQTLPGLEQINLSVVQANTPAIRFYKTLGFITYGIEPKAFKDDGEYYDEVHMVRFLEGT